MPVRPRNLHADPPVEGSPEPRSKARPAAERKSDVKPVDRLGCYWSLVAAPTLYPPEVRDFYLIEKRLPGRRPGDEGGAAHREDPGQIA